MLQLRILLVTMLVIANGSIAAACPFCSAVSQTFSEEISTMDVVALAELQKAGEISKLDTTDASAEVPKSTFIITKVIKGAEFLAVGDTFDTIYFGEAKKGRPFLAMATDAPKLIWSTPLILSDRAESYLGELPRLNGEYAATVEPLDAKLKKLKDDEAKAEIDHLKAEASAVRLAFFQEFLEDEDEMLARDAYDEFAKAPYADVIALKPKMNREQLIAFVKNHDVPSNRRRLYFTMLGVCGTQAESELLETFMNSDDRKAKAGLDALLACYMILNGEQGLDKVDELFLANKEAEYSDTYAAIMAIRFHGSETDVIPRSRLVKSLRHMLDRPELADLVIPDLARWEDWEVLPKLTELFVNADENSSWVRVPVINYLRACPLPIAAEKIEDLKKVDADAVKRAMTFFPVTSEKKEEKAEEANTDTEKQTSLEDFQEQLRKENDGTRDVLTQPVPIERESADALANQLSFPGKSGDSLAQFQTVISPETARANKAESQTSIDTPATLNQVESAADSAPNIWKLFGVTIIGVGLCFATMRSILGVSVNA